jgi:hypothetical protein
MARYFQNERSGDYLPTTPNLLAAPINPLDDTCQKSDNEMVALFI